MTAKYLRFLAILLGLTSVTSSVLYGNPSTVFIKPLFHFFLFAFYVRYSGKMNWLLALAISSALIGESLVAINFMGNFSLIMLLFSVYFLSNATLLRPILKRTNFRTEYVDMATPLIAVLGLFYLVFELSSMIFGELPNIWLYFPAMFSFLLFIFVCLYIAFFNKTNQNFPLFIVGVGYIAVCFFTFLFEFFGKSMLFLGLANSCEVMAQVTLVTYLANLKGVVRGLSV